MMHFGKLNYYNGKLYIYIYIYIYMYTRSCESILAIVVRPLSRGRTTIVCDWIRSEIRRAISLAWRGLLPRSLACAEEEVKRQT